MTKKKLKMKRRGGGTSDGVAFWRSGMSDELRGRIFRGAVVLLMAGSVALGLRTGLVALESHVHKDARFDRKLALHWAGPMPSWLGLPENRHIREDIERHAGLRPHDDILDAGLASRIVQSLSRPGIGWVERVNRVTVRPNGVVELDCRFRRPAAWILHRGYCYLVGDSGVRLPGKYDPGDCSGSNLLMIDGVGKAPPEVGRMWEGEDLVAGLKLASLIGGRPFQHQVSRIIVSNYDGRHNSHRPHIELATDFQDARILWGRAPDEEFGMEITAAQKIAVLEALYRESGRIDMRRSYVDIMTYPSDRVAMPEIAGSGGSIRG
ncbi:MAG: hypothetical protein O7B26_07480 [Planctomycetota bacterium]|nr:hypothetical protein [Planctomycetota bacterium]